MAGGKIERDDLHAALGLTFLIGVPGDETMAPHIWPMLARDAFLVAGARIFGFGIRDVHPPEAAVGLDQVSVFRQHFDASYKPLIARALENNQAVLAWQGWPGANAYQWGVIGGMGEGDGGIGIAGRAGSDLQVDGVGASEVELVDPPVQLYVVETYDAAEPPIDELFRVACRHARHALENQCGARFGVTTGPEGIDRWIERLHLVEVGDANYAARLAGHQSSARELVVGFESGIRFLKRQQDRVSAEWGKMIPHMIASCHKAATALASFAKTALPATGGDTADRRETLARQLTDTRAAVSELLTAMPS